MTQKSKPDYKSLLVIVVGMLVLSYVFKLPLLIKVGLGIGILGLLSETLAGWILFIWQNLAEVLGWINTRILLSVVFYVFVYPFSWLYKVTTNNALHLKNKDNTVFVERNHTYTPKDIENTW